jgi:hypothetical protein
MLILPLAPLDRAPAANNCNAMSPVDNTTVTGATSDANGTTGYGTNTDNGNTYNILSGASVAGTGIGLRFSNSGTVNNFGTITGAGAVTFDCGILGGTGTVNNAGVISATGAGVTVIGAGSVINSGSISRVGGGIFLQTAR